MDSSRGVLSGTMDRFKMVCTINNIFSILININLSALYHLFFSFVVFSICLIYFRINTCCFMAVMMSLFYVLGV
jgi:hypothetical protein